jgi:hypothetical protein
MPAIYQLDYCIPGPHPNWEEDSRRTLTAAVGPILPETQDSLEGLEGAQVVNIVKSFMPAVGSAIGLALVTGTGAAASIFGGAIIGSAVPVLGTVIGAVIGLIGSFLVGLFGGGDEALNVRSYYSSIIFTFTGVLPNYDLEDDKLVLNIMSKGGAVGVLDIILDRYVDIMNKTYFANPEYLPTVTKEAAVTFSQLTGYGQMMKNNEEKIALLKTTVNILGEIKDKIDDLNREYKTPDGQFRENKSEDEYDKDLEAQINAFGRLSSSMVNGDDIANADNLLKQIIDKKNYIYKNLLKGEYGCEADLMKPQKKFPWLEYVGGQTTFYGRTGHRLAVFPWSNFDVNSVKRMTYPFPILYDYNNSTAGEVLPDPWNSNYENPTKMPITNMYDTYGPGFLSFVFFGGHSDDYDGPDRLRISDLFPTGTEVHQYNFKALGSRSNVNGPVINNNDSSQLGGPFENIIGIY